MPVSRPAGHPLQGDVDVTRMSPWLLRIEMARDMMVDKKLLLSEVGGCGHLGQRHALYLGRLLRVPCLP